MNIINQFNILSLPGWKNSEIGHWQTLFEEMYFENFLQSLVQNKRSLQF